MNDMESLNANLAGGRNMPHNGAGTGHIMLFSIYKRKEKQVGTREIPNKLQSSRCAA